MSNPHSRVPPLSLGLASTVLGAVGLLLFVLPVLAIPISVCGMVAGICGTVIACVQRSADIRLAVPGAALCLLAVSIDIAVAYAPGGYRIRPAEPSSSSPYLHKPYVPPPAPFHASCATALHGHLT